MKNVTELINTIHNKGITLTIAPDKDILKIQVSKKTINGPEIANQIALEPLLLLSQNETGAEEVFLCTVDRLIARLLMAEKECVQDAY